MAQGIKDIVKKALDELTPLDSDTLVEQRYERLRHLGSFIEQGS